MLSTGDIMGLIQSLIWLLAGVGVFIVGMNFMSEALEKSAGEGMKNMLSRISNNRFSGVGIGAGVTAIIQSSSATSVMVIVLVNAGVMTLMQATPIIMGANIGTCVTALLASAGANANAKRVALIHFTFNVIGTVIFTIIVWAFKAPMLNLLVSLFPGNDTMSLQMRVSVFHVIFNVTTTVVLLPFVKQLVQYSCAVIKDKRTSEKSLSLRYVDDRLLSMPSVALMQAKKEIDHMLSLVEENIRLSFASVSGDPTENAGKITENEETIDFTNGELTQFLIKLSACVDERDEQKIGAYFHVLNDLERVGDHAENFHEIGQEMLSKKLNFSEIALSDIKQMYDVVIEMVAIARDAFDAENPDRLPGLAKLENQTDEMKRAFSAKHFSRLSEGNCSLEVSPYYTSTITGLERVADHIVNVGYSICNPVGDDKETN